MEFKSLLILFLISTCIEMNSGADQNLHSWTDDSIINPHSPGEEINQNQTGTSPAQQVNIDVNEDPFINLDPEEREKQAKEIFESEYNIPLNHYLWPELLNETYDDSWETLCFKLWKKPVLIQRCGARKLSYFPTYISIYRVTGRNDQIHNFFELLNCTCPFRKFRKGAQLFDSNHYFFVIPSKQHQQYYYILRFVDRLEVEVFDMRKAELDPKQTGI